MPQGQEPVSGGFVEAHEDWADSAGAAEQAAQGARSLRLGHRRVRAQEHGVHDKTRHVGRGHPLPRVHRLYIRRREEVRRLTTIFKSPLFNKSTYVLNNVVVLSAWEA